MIGEWKWWLVCVELFETTEEFLAFMNAARFSKKNNKLQLSEGVLSLSHYHYLARSFGLIML